MKPEDIIVGTLYGRSDYPDFTWIGAGKRKPFRPCSETYDKCLVLVEAPPEDAKALGLIFKTPDDEQGCYEDDWNLFYMKEKPTVILKEEDTHRDGGTKSFLVLLKPSNWTFGDHIIKYRGLGKKYSEFREKYMSGFPDENGRVIENYNFVIQ